MKTWNYIELVEDIHSGTTMDDYLFFEMQIEGWNDDENYSDVEELATVRFIVIDDDEESDEVEIEVVVIHHYDEIASNITVLRLIECAVDVLKDFIDYDECY